jgi:hypothetical protein
VKFGLFSTWKCLILLHVQSILPQQYLSYLFFTLEFLPNPCNILIQLSGLVCKNYLFCLD